MPAQLVHRLVQPRYGNRERGGIVSLHGVLAAINFAPGSVPFYKLYLGVGVDAGTPTYSISNVTNAAEYSVNLVAQLISKRLALRHSCPTTFAGIVGSN